MQKFWRYRSYFFVGFLALFTSALWVAVFAATPSGVLTVAVLDVGQGDSIYIESPTGQQLVIDGGPGSALLQALPAVMPMGDRSLDAIVETHPDADHISGFVDLLARYTVDIFIKPGIAKDTATARALEREVADKKISTYLARRGMWLELGGGAELHILSPERDVSRITKTNDGAVVAHLVYGKTTMLFMADVSSAVENRLVLLDGTGLKSDILKVAHHGSKYSSASAFLSAVSPAAAVISVGKNSYGHPTDQALSRLAAYSGEILRTDQAGTIVFVSDGENFVRK
ncbi:MBL fold metallo-hydrolase [Patescibacteria group bacterium]|nr:MBL fold metallo-hydrolase [Patescibacteria group bacterium]